MQNCSVMKGNAILRKLCMSFEGSPLMGRKSSLCMNYRTEPILTVAKSLKAPCSDIKPRVKQLRPLMEFYFEAIGRDLSPETPLPE
ncbi:hypothetical protein AVEN_219113-1 [Araneus ventricosus]|uniref:Uncharacterized protein n=1 Tax=Araneus ventricosus TaxID=182803 RepID=A0A4Y2T2T2_ARAVE|nr:hypothetical protein AVEN_219113-1 [Araneus ventricosus]